MATKAALNAPNRTAGATTSSPSVTGLVDPDVCAYPIPEVADLPEDIQVRMQTVLDKAGFVPNVMRALARRPAEFRAFFAYHDALMEGEGPLSIAEREMIVVATSGVNHCQYCVVAHGAILRIRAKRPLLADQVAINYKQADISSRERAILDFAMKVATDSSGIEEADRQAAQAAGLTQEELWDITAITAFFAMSNRLASGTGMKPNAEFYLMGRLPKPPKTSQD
ncbi:MAG: hypothetical protein RLZZ344_1226 [Pseudomonadota bacterium]